MTLRFYFDVIVVVQTTRRIKYKYFKYILNRFLSMNNAKMNYYDSCIIVLSTVVDNLFINLLKEHISLNSGKIIELRINVFVILHRI